MVADGAYDREGLMEWLLAEWWVGLDGVSRVGGRGFHPLLRRWLVERSLGWLL